jgi:putative membrane protein
MRGNKMKVFVLIAVSLLSAVSVTKAADLTSVDKKFVQEAAAGNAAEVKLAQLAQQKSQNSKIKEFADRMITDHTKANDDLKNATGVTLPDHLTGKAKVAYDKLDKLSGTDFDRSYINDMVKDHEEVAAQYKKEQDTVKDAALKGYVDNTLPVVESHLAMAKDIQKTVASRT